MTTSKAELRLAAALLENASDEFSNHGCNDFDLSKYMNPTEIETFVREAYVQNAPKGGLAEFEEIRPERRAYAMPDWWIMSALAQKLLDAASDDL